MPVEECMQQILSKKLKPGQKATKQDLAIARSECEKKRERIAKLNFNTKLLSAKLNSIIIGKLLEAKKKQ